VGMMRIGPTVVSSFDQAIDLQILDVDVSCCSSLGININIENMLYTIIYLQHMWLTLNNIKFWGVVQHV
jgi:hypothetical protein